MSKQAVIFKAKLIVKLALDKYEGCPVEHLSIKNLNLFKNHYFAFNLIVVNSFSGKITMLNFGLA